MPFVTIAVCRLIHSVTLPTRSQGYSLQTFETVGNQCWNNRNSHSRCRTNSESHETEFPDPKITPWPVQKDAAEVARRAEKQGEGVEVPPTQAQIIAEERASEVQAEQEVSPIP